MTQKEQEGVIKRFKTGEKNLLLATSVAEEGLDISDCNYVIRYDMMGNEISSVQSRGRVRFEIKIYLLPRKLKTHFTACTYRKTEMFLFLLLRQCFSAGSYIAFETLGSPITSTTTLYRLQVNNFW